jgi:mannosyltransferase
VSIGRVVRAVKLSDASPPVYYVLLHGWTRTFGTLGPNPRFVLSPLGRRTFPLLYALACRLGGNRAAVSACLLFTVAP